VPTFAGTLDSLEPIRAYVGAAAANAGLDSSKVYDLCMAVDEIATNIVTHGYEESGGSGSIDVEAAPESGSVVVRLFDSSPEYDPDERVVSDEELATELADRPIGGLGIFLVRKSVDEFRYARLDGRNVHTFRVKLP